MSVLVNEKGEYLDIFQEEKELLDGQHVVPLEGYYEVFNAQLYSQAVWDFKLNKWKGVGEPEPIPVPQPSEVELLKTKLDFATKQLEQQEELIVELAMKVYQ